MTASELRTVIFDVDGTLVDSERDGHRVAFNRAFAEFGLPDRWDEPTYGRLLDGLAGAGVTVGVATTGSRAWVEPLLDRQFGLTRFAAVVTGDDVSERKPHPEAYLLALRRLGAEAATTVAVEDSDNGVRAARAAGLPVVAVTNDYTVTQDLDAAAVVLDGFGLPTSPAAVRRDPAGAIEDGLLDVPALQKVAMTRDRQDTAP